MSKNNPVMFKGVPPNSDDLLAYRAQQYVVMAKHVPEEKGITIRVIKKQGRYYVSEWRVGPQSFSGLPTDSPIARISRVKGKRDRWRLAWMMRDLQWHDLGDEYEGSFEDCLSLIVNDPEGFFWG